MSVLYDNKGKTKNVTLTEGVQDAWYTHIKILMWEYFGKYHRVPNTESLFLPQWTFILSSGEGTLEHLAFQSHLVISWGRIERKAANSKSSKQSMKEKDN